MLSVYSCFDKGWGMRRGGLSVSAPASISRGSGLRPKQGDMCCVFWQDTVLSHLTPPNEYSTGEFFATGEPCDGVHGVASHPG